MKEPSRDRRPGTVGPVIEPAPSWSELAARTPARIALGRSGVSLPTREILGFGLAHARARDAVHEALDLSLLCGQLEQHGWPVEQVASRAPDRRAYLARPDWGRRLDQASDARLRAKSAGGGTRPAVDLLLVLGDGLSARAVQMHALPMLQALRPTLAGLRLAPLVIATQARVALADEIGERYGAGMVAILIGERPGLSSPDSLGVYLTANPRVGCVDAERVCISNIHAAGLSYQQAAVQVAQVIATGLREGRTGVTSLPPAPGRQSIQSRAADGGGISCCAGR